MDMEHIVVMESVRAYLLGKLDEAAATSLEEMYFSSPACLVKIEEIEAGLISDYLDARLPPADRARFEQRYLTLPVLRQKLAEAREARAAAMAQTSRESAAMGWRLAVAAVALVAIGIGIWSTALRHPTANNRIAKGAVEELPIVALSLTPGVSKGSEMARNLVVPATGAHVRLVLELPGRTDSLVGLVRLTRQGDNGDQDNKSTKLGPFRSKAGSQSQELTVPLEAAQFESGDYLLEVADPAGNILETYSFRITIR